MRAAFCIDTASPRGYPGSVTLLLLLACTGPTPDDTASDTAAGDIATIAILSPVDEATVCGAPLVVTTEVSGIMLVDPFPDDTDLPEPGTGHIDLAMNGQEEDEWMFAGEQIVVTDIADGYYQLKVELSSADHTPIEPYAGDLVYITVAATACE